MLTMQGCSERQARFLARMEETGIDAVLISHPRDIYYFTGLLADDRRTLFPSLLFLAPRGRSWLATWREGEAAVQDVLHYSPDEFSTMNPDNHARLASLVCDRATRSQRLGSVGFQFEHLPRSTGTAFEGAAAPRSWTPVDGHLFEMQLRKDPDEIESIRGAIRATLAGYRQAERSIRPGVNEFEVYIACQAAAQSTTGAAHYYGGDFRSGERGGPARERPAEAGEMYIIDAQADVEGYWSDMSRTWAVNGEPTDLQASVYQHLARILQAVPDMAVRGRDTKDFWRELDARIREHPRLADEGLRHHGGHGVGLRPHEGPDLNPDRGGFFQVGNVFSCEPGAYLPELRCGIRLENMFLVTAAGVETLSEFPLDPAPRRSLAAPAARP
jgi:Xaa-Pro dipeptidase